MNESSSIPPGERPGSPARARGGWWYARRVVSASCVALAAAYLLVLAWTDRPYVLDLASHFALHAAVLACAVAIVFAACASRIAALALGVLGVSMGAVWWAGARAPAGDPPRAGEAPFRIVLFNAGLDHSKHDAALMQWLMAQQADAIVLVEAPWGFVSDYPFLKRDYAFIIEPEAGMMWAVVVLSKHPAEILPIAVYSEENKFSFAARRSLLVRKPGATPLLLSAMHPPSPRTVRTWRLALDGTTLNARLFRAWDSRSDLPLVVAGDFNSSPVGRVHRTFARESGLRAWSPRFGAGTWPARLPTWLALPIDRVWTNASARVVSIQVGPRFRSDHRPIVVDLMVPSAPPEAEPGREGDG